MLNQQALLAERANPDSAKPEHCVTFLGDKGSYSYPAAQRYLRRSGVLHEHGLPTFARVIEGVKPLPTMAYCLLKTPRRAVLTKCTTSYNKPSYTSLANCRYPCNTHYSPNRNETQSHHQSTRAPTSAHPVPGVYFRIKQRRRSAPSSTFSHENRERSQDPSFAAIGSVEGVKFTDYNPSPTTSPCRKKTSPALSWLATTSQSPCKSGQTTLVIHHPKTRRIGRSLAGTQI